MAFTIVGGSGEAVDVAGREYVKTTTAATIPGDLLSETGAGLTRSTSSDTTAGATRFYAIATSTQTAANTTVEAVKLTPGMLILANCTNDTASNQVGRRRPVSDQALLNNSSTDSNANTAPFEIVAVVGSASDRKVLVKFLGSGQVTA